MRNLIEEYKELTANCAKTDYSDKKSVKRITKNYKFFT
jgi:hypothetical protein